MAKIYKSRLDWVKSISQEELEKRFKDAKTLAETAKKKISFYEEELERRKNKNWLPSGDVLYSANYELLDFFRVELKMETTFENYSCFLKYLDFLKAINEASVANAKGEPIDIKVLCPLFRKGYVFYDNIFGWRWSKEKPEIFKNRWTIRNDATYTYLDAFNIKPADNWEYSLMECGL